MGVDTHVHMPIDSGVLLKPITDHITFLLLSYCCTVCQLLRWQILERFEMVPFLQNVQAALLSAKQRIRQL